MENKIAVHCPTEDEWNKVIKKAESKGWRWKYKNGRGNRLRWIDDKEHTCLSLGREDKIFSFGKKSKYILEETTILSATDYLAYGLGGKPEFNVGSRVEVLRGGYKGLVGEIVSTTNFSVKVKTKSKETEGLYWYFSTYKDRLKLIEGRAFEVGDRVRVVSGAGKSCTGDDYSNQEGVVEDLGDGLTGVRFNGGRYGGLNPKYLKLIKKGKDKVKKEHTVPLRVDDRVRVVGSELDFKGDSGTVKRIYGNPNFVSVVRDNEWDNSSYCMESKNLELIPTEKDITVGSVWEFKSCRRVVIERGKGYIKTDLIKGIRGERCSGVHYTWGVGEFLREKMKLIHRGDEVVEESFADYTEIKDGDSFTVTGGSSVILDLKQTNKKEKKMEVTREDVIVGSQWTAPTHYGGDVVTVTKIDGLNDPHFNIGATDKSSWIMSDFLKHMRPLKTKPNKKGEKKMKKAEKVVALGNLVEDTDCNNQGKVVALYPKKELVSYEEEDGNVVTTHVSNLISRFKMPKPKPVKGKKKKRG